MSAAQQHARRATVHLCFHGIGTCVAEREPGEARYWVSADAFRRVLDEVAERPWVALSFDDGNRSDVEVALPALRERGLTATFFALAGRLEDARSLSRGDVRALADAGMAIGSHGWDHVSWRSLTDADARRELVDARSALSEAAGASVAAAALPLGRYGRDTLRRLREASYAAVYSSDRFPVRDSAWLRARYSVTADDTLESVRRILAGRPRLVTARNALASAVKRMR
ncbi:polysaccharide deacetylase family protein [Agrococcus carbonis]|uniref:Polysaccharide deacetylase n=1 Tax=Agrococcus carbonis TaxID=684552 RepID=A0A1H1LBD8_9MICO|nr:polysaccharide deacetylase family protein [Agrococcus carbonis]SDR71816.1 Polysaccharide deacetylase [Agrococcus carbonis]